MQTIPQKEGVTKPNELNSVSIRQYFKVYFRNGEYIELMLGLEPKEGTNAVLNSS
jgi:hypothetical protein